MEGGGDEGGRDETEKADARNAEVWLDGLLRMAESSDDVDCVGRADLSALATADALVGDYLVQPARSAFDCLELADLDAGLAAVASGVDDGLGPARGTVHE